MKVLSQALLVVVLSSTVPVFAGRFDVERIRSDLVGHTMGGREKCWAFQSRSQIKKLTIDGQREEAGKRIYEVTLRLSDERVGGLYEAKATVTYEQAGKKWVCRVCGLRSLTKIE